MLTTLFAQGDDVALVPVVPVRKELTTYEAAALLNVSRPFLIKLLDEGIIPSIKVGTHRRVRLHDMLEYRRRRSEKNKRLLDEILSFAQEQGGTEPGAERRACARMGSRLGLRSPQA
jgi:excisionase family DNA binding protein